MSPDTSKSATEAKEATGAEGAKSAKSAKGSKGKVKEKLGWAAGDREVEAKGRVEREEAAAEEGHVDGDAVESVEGAEREVRRANEEID